jgi:hypothetical protein
MIACLRGSVWVVGSVSARLYASCVSLNKESPKTSSGTKAVSTKLRQAERELVPVMMKAGQSVARQEQPESSLQVAQRIAL